MNKLLKSPDYLIYNVKDNRLLTSHISLFMAMFFYSPSDGEEFFRISRRILMRFSRIKSIATYHKCIRDLSDWGYITYHPSYDPYRASMVSLIATKR